MYVPIYYIHFSLEHGTASLSYQLCISNAYNHIKKCIQGFKGNLNEEKNKRYHIGTRAGILKRKLEYVFMSY